MTTRITLFILATVLVLTGTACQIFKAKTPKESPNVAIEVEAGFQQHWIDKRTADLTAAGTAPTVARAQAEKEFHETYRYLRAADPGKR